MQSSDLLKYVNNPQLLNKDSVKQLQRLVIDFPYFQAAHLLLSLASKKWDTSVYQQSLKKTAIVATNRAHLFRLIHQAEEEIKEQVAEVLVPERKEDAADTHKEESRQELDILKAAELSTEAGTPEKTEAPVAEKTTAKPLLNAEEILEREIGKQVVDAFVEKEILKTPEFNRTEPKQEKPESFADWLSFLKKNNGQPYEQIEAEVKQEKAKAEALKRDEPEKKEEEAPSRKSKNMAIIDKIIENSPGLIRQKEEQRFYTPDLKAKESLLENEHLVTETLARIYALQGSVNKAIRAYEILGLRYPQKRAYFDSLIQKLKSNT